MPPFEDVIMKQVEDEKLPSPLRDQIYKQLITDQVPLKSP
jgi:hypothetical protein